MGRREIAYEVDASNAVATALYRWLHFEFVRLIGVVPLSDCGRATRIARPSQATSVGRALPGALTYSTIGQKGGRVV